MIIPAWDRNEEGYFEFSGNTKIDVNRYNSDSQFIVLHAGAIPGYEITDVKLRCHTPDGYDENLGPKYEHYKEKELLIVWPTVTLFYYL